MGLRAWSFEWNQETRQFSQDPKHDWASHPGDGFSYGAQVMQEHIPVKREKAANKDVLAADVANGSIFTLPCLEDLWKSSAKTREARL